MRRIIGTVALLAALLSTGCAKSVDTAATVTALAKDPLVSNLMSSLGLNLNQAIGGAGALLGLAQENLGADWTKVAGAIPGASQLISQAKTLGGITGKFGSLAALAPAFSKMSLNQDQVKSLVPALTDYVGKAAGPDVATLLAGAIK